jgi:hypothetical protein
MKNSWLEAKREIMFPECKDFTELFTVQTKRQCFYEKGIEVSTYCSINEHGFHHSLEVMPKPCLLEFIREHMIPVSGGVFFDVTIHKGGQSLVTVKYNCICGGRWLARVQTNTILF